MELFVVNRYLEDTDTPADQEANEKALKRLNRLAKKRRESEKLDVEKPVQEVKKSDVDSLNKDEKIRKKKHKSKPDIETSITDDLEPQNKKRKSELVEEIPNCVDGDVNEIQHAHLSKKTSKKLKTKVDLLNEVDCNTESLPEKRRKVDDQRNGHVVHKRHKKRCRPDRRKSRTLTLTKPSPSQNCHTVGGYTIIGQVENKKSQEVKRILPDWLAKPTVVSVDLGGQLTPVDGVQGLNNHLVNRLRQNGITHFFPVQSSVVPWLLKSATRNWIRQPDLCVSSPTGSGKTLAFVLPVVQTLSESVVCSIKALAVLPVRDLALQVYKVFEAYCSGTRLQVGLAIGDRILTEERNSLIKDGKSLVDILVCTPGRLVNHISDTAGFSLADLKFLIIDEADRMMQMIKQDWLNEVEKCVLKSRGQSANSVLTVDRMADLRKMPQKLLFSATLSQDPERLQDAKLFRPKLFTSVTIKDSNTNPEGVLSNGVQTGEFIGKYTTPKELNEVYIQSENFLKPLVLLHFIHNLGYRHLLCFTNSVESSHRLALLLSMYGGIKVREFSSNLSTANRNKILNGFHKGSIDIIVCSDAMTRGMDVKDVDYVISYDLPPYLKTYIHRVGRTARAGRQGTAISLVERKELAGFRKLMVGRTEVVIEPITIDTALLEPMEMDYKKALERMKNAIMEEKSKA